MRGSQAASPGMNTLLVRSKEIGVASLNSKPAPRPQLLKRLRWRRSQQRHLCIQLRALSAFVAGHLFANLRKCSQAISLASQLLSRALWDCESSLDRMRLISKIKANGD